MIDHQFSIRITVVRWDGLTGHDAPRGQLHAYPALARWRGWSRKSRRGKVLPEEMSWCEADTRTGVALRGSSVRGSVLLDDEGVRWCRGWSGVAVEALLAAAALAC